MRSLKALLILLSFVIVSDVSAVEIKVELGRYRKNTIYCKFVCGEDEAEQYDVGYERRKDQRWIPYSTLLRRLARKSRKRTLLNDTKKQRRKIRLLKRLRSKEDIYLEHCSALVNIDLRARRECSNTPPSPDDNDKDLDTILDDIDNCPNASNLDQADCDRDGIGDVCDPTSLCSVGKDTDEDGISDDDDNCPLIGNPDQADSNGNGIGDACEEDEPVAISVPIQEISQPHLRLENPNLKLNPHLDGYAGWVSFSGDTGYEPTISRTDDDTGSIRIGYSGSVESELIPVTPGKTYTYSSFIKSETSPVTIFYNVAAHNSNGNFMYNMSSTRIGTSKKDTWEEANATFIAPPGSAYFRVKMGRAESATDGNIYADDFYVGEGLGYISPPSEKQEFDGSHVRVDELGNVEVNRSGEWEPFFPLCVYSDNFRAASFYSEQGFNCSMWGGADPTSLNRWKNAVSDFNPKGMMAGFQIVEYSIPTHPSYGDTELLRVEAIKNSSAKSALLFYYWDNENRYDEWDVPVQVNEALRRADFSVDKGKLGNPVYILQGNYGVARTHSAGGVADINGTYIGGKVATINDRLNIVQPPEVAGGGLTNLNNLESQISPPVIAQFNTVDHAGEMRMRLYRSIMGGARGMGFWRDCFGGCNSNSQANIGPIDQKDWWPDIPNLRREVDKLIPIIRQPHWTSWSVRVVSNTGGAYYGLRTYNDEAYIILSNNSDAPASVTFEIQNLPYEVSAVEDYFTDNVITTVSGGRLTLELPGLGIGRGTAVYRLAR